MMAELAEDIQVKVASNGSRLLSSFCECRANVNIAAEDFVDSYYLALNKEGRSGVTSFYLKPTSTRPIKPDISINGNVFDDPTQVPATYDKSTGRAHYDVQSFDCQVLNTNYNIGAEDNGLNIDKDGKKLSVLVMVSGGVKYVKDGGDEHRGFTESITLAPNWDALNSKASKGEKKWLISSQNFRLVL